MPHRTIPLFIGLLPWIGACGEESPAPPVDPYVADLQRRVAALRPHVEREIGRELGAVEIVVLPRKEIAALVLPTVRDSLTRVDNGPRGDALATEANATARAFAYATEAFVDARGRIVLPDPSVDRDSLAARLAETLGEFRADPDPRRLDVVLLHEMIRVHQRRHLEQPAFTATVTCRADILARRLVRQGHAAFLARRIAGKAGLAGPQSAWSDAQTDNAVRLQQEVIRTEHAAGTTLLFPHGRGHAFVVACVARLGYDAATRRMFRRPPSLAEVMRPETYDGPAKAPSAWGPVFEDVLRWLARERGAANVTVISEGTDGFREGALFEADGVFVRVLVAADESSANDLLHGWLATIEAAETTFRENGYSVPLQRSRETDRWFLHKVNGASWHVRRLVVRTGVLVIDVECNHDSELEQTVERLSGRARTFLTDPAWRKTWLEGGAAAARSTDPGLRLGAVSKQRRYVADDDWEVRWMGRFVEADLAAARGDPHGAVVARALRAARTLDVELPDGAIFEAFGHDEAAVRRAAWRAVNPWSAEKVAMLKHVARALDDPDRSVRQLAVDGLSHLTEIDGAAAVFRKALTTDDRFVRGSALATLTIYGADLNELAPDVAALLEEHPDTAAEALGEFGKAAAAALPQLRKALANPKARENAAVAIWKVAADVEPLLALVRDSMAAGEPRGLVALADAGPAAAAVVPDVVKALAHPSRWIRQRAAKALGAIGGDDARRALVARLGVERDLDARAAINEALKR